ncbi:hypothetical protein XENOCAPTIV_006375, partial [Xenoophorus captivus]
MYANLLEAFHTLNAKDKKFFKIHLFLFCLKDESQKMYYVVMENCQGGNLADKIREMPTENPRESEILGWIAEICMALKVIHEAALLHKALMPK